MNDLQLAVVGGGAVLVAGLWCHSRWQEWRQKRVAEHLLDTDRGDALLADPSPEASYGEDRLMERPHRPAVRKEERGDRDERREPVFAAPPVASSVSPTPTHSPVAASVAGADEPPPYLLTSDVDYIASFELGERMDGAAVLASSSEALKGNSKRVVWVGFEEVCGEWELLRMGGEYRRLRAGIALADRTGPLSTNVLESFCCAMEALADEFTAVVTMPPARDALARAVQLDRFCAEVDIQLSVNVLPGELPFLRDGLRVAALGAGMRLGDDGLLSFLDVTGDSIFNMQSVEDPFGNVTKISFVLELPCVANGEVAFDQMMIVSRKFAEAVGGVMVDDMDRPVSEQFIVPVRGQIKLLQARMVAEGVPPGSAMALRLFS